MELVTAEDLASYYSQPGYAEAWDALEDYNKVLRYTGQHPNKGSAAVSSALELPRGRVQSWMSGSRPTVVRAIQVAERKDWIPLETDDAELLDWTALVAWIHAQGSISTGEYLPMFGVSTDTEIDYLTRIFEKLDMKPDIYHADTTDRATEVRISEHRIIVGRILVELGAPLGTRETHRSVPMYLEDGRLAVQSVFLAIYLITVAEHWEWREGYVIHQEEYPDSYRESLATLFEAVIPESVNRDIIEVNEDSIFVAEEAANAVFDSVPWEFDAANSV